MASCAQDLFQFHGIHLVCSGLYLKKQYGMPLCDLSYKLSRLTSYVATPKCPLSDLSLHSYLAYWVSTNICFLWWVLQFYCLPHLYSFIQLGLNQQTSSFCPHFHLIYLKSNHPDTFPTSLMSKQA